MHTITAEPSPKSPALTAILICTSLLLLTLGCATGPKISREVSDEDSDLSGNWNDNDSKLVSEEMIRDCLVRPWLPEWQGATGRRPVVVVGGVRNQSMEHINTSTFVHDLERELLNSGKVRFVSGGDQRGAVKGEIEWQAGNATLESIKSMGQQLGADFILLGQLNQIDDAAGGKRIHFYQVELELVKVESGEKVWIGQKKIKKLVERRRVGF